MPHGKQFEPTTRNGSWIALSGSNAVRLMDIEATNWSLRQDLFNYDIAHNANGGLFAAYPKNVFVKHNSVLLVSSDGRPHRACPAIALSDNETVHFMCWNNLHDHLVLVLSNGTVRFYNYLGEPAASPISIEVSQLFHSTDNGFLALSMGTTSAKLLLAEFSNIKEYRVQSITLPPLFQLGLASTTCLAIPQSLSTTGHTEAFLTCAGSSGTQTSSVVRCIFGPSPRYVDQKVHINGGNVQHMALAPSGSEIAFLMEDGTLYTTSRSFEEIFPLLHVDTETRPTQLAWCGEKCICFTQVSTLASTTDATITLCVVDAQDPEICDCVSDLSPDTLLFPERDGIRLVSKHSYQFLQVVTPEAQRVFARGSRAPGAILLSTFDIFMCGNAEAVRMIQNMQRNANSLIDAINDCIAAASCEFDMKQQKRLLRIAGFGKSFCPLYDSNHFVHMARRMRVRNTLATTTGILLSETQLRTIGEQRLLKRLIGCKYHQAAYCVAEVLDLKANAVLADWALSKLSCAKNIDQEAAAAEAIVRKLKECTTTPGVDVSPFVEVAKEANMKGRHRAAVCVIEADPNAERQVTTFLSISEPELALRAAVASSDCDLIFTVIMHLLRSGTSGAVALITSHTVSRNLLLRYLTACEGSRSLVTEYMNAHPRFQTQLDLLKYLHEEHCLRASLAGKLKDEVQWEVAQDWKSTSVQSAIASTRKEVVRRVGQNHSVFARPAGSPGSAAPTTSAQERFLRLQSNLLSEQTKLMRDLNDSRFLSASAADTIRYALESGQVAVGQRLKGEYNIPEKMYQRIMLDAYACTGQWELIDQMAGGSNGGSSSGSSVSSAATKGKLLLTGETLVSVLLAYNRPEQAKKYIPRIPQIVQRMEFYVQCGDWVGAGADCRLHNEPDLLQQLRDRAKGNVRLLQQIDEGWDRRVESSGLTLARLFSS